ncbi:MAG TPA: protein kinase [Rudaea sp.]|jgi:serine/threonine protein kinase|nr:protein kinase [Rudaea sp.]
MAIGSVQIPGYEILRPLGTGGMSTVYLALQRSLDRKVAIKVMRRGGDLASDENTQAEKRFLLEGRMMAKLPHRNIVAVYDIVSNDAMAYISMEFLDGGTLSDRMRDGISLADAVSVIVQIASALDFAHTHGVVHRDLKPANIMFRDSGTPVLTDFGIARYQDGSATRLTQTGMLVGTPTYMSPEQINGQAVDGRADLYSLGILFYELLAGHAPFRGDTPIAVLMAHLTQPAPTLPDEHVAFQPVLDRMLAKNRDERYSGMKEFSQDLKSRLIHSDTLLMRLNVDPNAPSSEQLRALGFGSTPTGQGLRNSLLGSLPTPRPTPMPAVQPAQAPSQRSRIPSVMTITAVIGIVLVAIGAWLSLHGRGGLNKDEQELVGFWLDRAEHRIKTNQLVVPADDSAFAYLQKVQQRDPDNPRAQVLFDEIAKALSAQSEQSLKAGKIDEAADLDSQALLLRPDDPQLRALAAQIALAQKSEKSRQQVLTLLQRAEVARNAGKVFGENGAYPLLQQAAQFAPNDANVRKTLDAVIAQQLAAPRKSLDAGEAARANDELNRMQSYIGNEPAFAALRTQADAQQKKEIAEKALLASLARGSQQLRAGRLAEPGGDNAYETLGEMTKQVADDKRVAEFGTALGKALLAEAKRFDSIGQSPRALDRLGLALKAAPDLADAQTLQTQIQQRIGERASKIAQTLSSARQAIAEQRFVPPANDDAYGALQSVLQQDSSNADARKLLAELPSRIVEAAQARAQNDAGAAMAMVDASRKIFPQDAMLMSLSTKLQTQLTTEKAVAQAQQTRGRVEKILAATDLSPDQLRSAAHDLTDLLASDPQNKATLALREQFADALRDELQSANDTTRFDARAAFVKEQNKLFGGEPRYDELVASLPALRTKIADAEKARIEAERGELVLNAYPWGNVDSIVDANRQKVALPAEASTPLVLTLPAGSYVITFKHPKAAKPVQVIAKVEARKRVTANAAFPTISSKEYFSRVGW